MKKWLAGFLAILLILTAGCGKKADAVSEETQTDEKWDFPGLIMVEDSLYKLGNVMPAEVEESAVIGYTTAYTDTLPTQNGETNFNQELGMPYAKVEGGIAVLYENEWHLCVLVED